MLNKVCYCLITSDYRSDNTLQCDSEHTIQMRARLSTVSNFTMSQLLSIFQNWIKNTSEIIVDGEVLTVTSVYFLSNDSILDLTPIQTSNYETNMKNIVILFTASGSASGFLLLLCACCIIILIKKLKSKRNYKLKPKFVVNTISNNVISLQYIYI